MPADLPQTPRTALHDPTRPKDPLVELELERRAVMLDGIETRTCVHCGEARATVVAALPVPGRFSSIQVRVALCERCHDDILQAYGKVRRMNRVSRGVYFAQLGALIVYMASGGGGFVVSALSLLLIGSWAGAAVLRRRLLRDQPRLLSLGPTTLRLRAPNTWARVLSDEKPAALARPALKPIGPASPR